MNEAVLAFDPLAILSVLESASVDYVVIGGFAATIHGSPLRTGDADICPSRRHENLERLAAALEQLQARIRTAENPEGIAFPYDATFLSSVGVWNLVTRYGWLDISFQPTGTQGYDDLRREAMRFDLGDGLIVRVASLADVIRSKEAAGREKDRHALPTLRRLLEQQAEP